MGAYIYNPTFHPEDWTALKIDREQWSNAFLWQIWKHHLPEIEAWKTEHRKNFSGHEPDVPEGPYTHIATDVWTTEDALGYEAYAYAIYRFIAHGQTRPPLTISVPGVPRTPSCSVPSLVRSTMVLVPVLASVAPGAIWMEPG